MREGSGRPGPRYWQQRADYTIRAALDTATHTIAGTATIRYANNSPDTLGYLWLQLDQNIYRADSRGAAVNPTDARFSGRGFEGGYTIAYVRAVRGGRSGGQAGKTPLATTLNGTMMRVNLDRPLGPGAGREVRHDRPDHREDRGRPAVHAARGREPHPHVALHGQERARRRLGRRGELHLGRERLRRRPHSVVLSPRGERRLGALHRVRAALDQALLGDVVPLPLPERHQP